MTFGIQIFGVKTFGIQMTGVVTFVIQMFAVKIFGIQMFREKILVATELESYNIDIAALRETRLLSNDSMVDHGYTPFFEW